MNLDIKIIFVKEGRSERKIRDLSSDFVKVDGMTGLTDVQKKQMLELTNQRRQEGLKFS